MQDSFRHHDHTRMIDRFVQDHVLLHTWRCGCSDVVNCTVRFKVTTLAYRIFSMLRVDLALLVPWTVSTADQNPFFLPGMRTSNAMSQRLLWCATFGCQLMSTRNILAAVITSITCMNHDNAPRQTFRGFGVILVSALVG